jgi:hypothetical protein
MPTDGSLFQQLRGTLRDLTTAPPWISGGLSCAPLAG